MNQNLLDLLTKDVLFRDLTLSPGATPGDRLLCRLACLLRQGHFSASRVQELLRGGDRLSPKALARLREQAPLLHPLCATLQDEFSEGYSLANEHDEATAQAAEHSRLLYESVAQRLVTLGSPRPAQAWGLWGWHEDGRPVALSLDGGLVILLMGIPGSGKTRAAHALGESAIRIIPGLTSSFHRRTAFISFGAPKEMTDLPELVAGLRKNPRQEDLDLLAQRLGVKGACGLLRLNLVVPSWQIREYEPLCRPFFDLGLRLLPLHARLPELGQTGLEAVLSAHSDAAYVQHLLDVAMEAYARGQELDMAVWHEIIEESDDLNKPQKRAAHRKLRLLDKIIGPDSLWDLAGPDQATVVWLGGRGISEKDVLPLVVAFLCGFAQHSPRHGSFLRLLFLDEMNRFERSPQVVQHLMTIARQIRHRGSILMLSGQDFDWLPDEMMGLASVFAMFRITSPVVFERTVARIKGYGCWRFEDVCHMLPGEAVVSVTEATDRAWRAWAQKMGFRPLLCEHGGHTRAEL